jgi:hypothetical protein
MVRKGPTDSATLFSIGTKKRGNDGNMWKITKTKAGTKRWQKITTGSTKTKKNTSVANLNSLKKKYYVNTSGSKKQIALGLWKVSGEVMDNKDLRIILKFLPENDKKRALKLLKERENEPITNYRNMWEPKPKPLGKMNRDELISRLEKFRDAWEKITTRNSDLDRARLNSESNENLRSLLKFYYSDESKQLAGNWLRKI